MTKFGIEQATEGRQAMRRHLIEVGAADYEGASSPEELTHLANLAITKSADRIAEVGFNAGYSSYAFLRSRPEARVVSFDIGAHACVRAAKDYIDREFPGRHTLIIGDSQETVPEYAAANPDARFDLVFIDGGHDYPIAKADLANFRPLSHPDSTVVMDDITPWLEWGVGPTRAWAEAIEQGFIIPEEYVQDGQTVEQISPSAKRAWAVGRYATHKGLRV